MKCLDHRMTALWFIAVVLALTFAQPVWAQSNGPPPLPPRAQDALDRGVKAAQARDYARAIAHFQEAHKIAPDSPVVYFNMGLAESKIPTRELRAMAWFGAYLAAYPDASNMATVKAELDLLRAKSQTDIMRLIALVQDVAGQTPHRLLDVADLWLKAGDIDAALKISNSLQDDAPRTDVYQSIVRKHVVAAQASAGDLAAASATAETIQDAWTKSEAKFDIARHQITSGDTANGRNTLAAAENAALPLALSSKYDREEKLWSIAMLQVTASDVNGARRTAELLKSADRKKQLQDRITSESTLTGQPPHPSPFTVSDWLRCLDNDIPDCSLNTAPFLDLVGHLKSLTAVPSVDLSGVPADLKALYGKRPPPDDPEEIFFKLRETASTILRKQSIIDEELKR